MSRLSRHPLWLVFALALGARLLFLFAFERPILFAHPYTYFTGALRIAEHPDAWNYVVTSEEWRTWDKHWTIAPLYFLFVAGVFKLTGTSLLALQVAQCVLDASVAALVAWMGLRLVGPRGAWAGVAYGVYWSAMELPTQTLTENLHTLLSVAGLCLAATAAGSGPDDQSASLGRARLALCAGLVLGLAALTRSVSSAFIPLVALYLWRRGGWRAWRQGLWPGFLLCLGAACVILPWTARNVFVIGDPVPIESTAYENILWANHLGTPAEYRAHMDRIGALPTPAAKREAALAIAVASVRAHPDLFLEKVARNFWHFLRPEGLDGLLRIERSVEPWGHVKSIVGDDLLTLCAVPLVLVFAFGGRPSPLRTLVLLWCGYFLFMVIVVFHNEVRYRASVAPFAAAAALGGLAVLRDPERRRPARLAFGVGVALVAVSISPYVGRAGRALWAYAGVRSALSELRAGEAERAARLADAAAERDPTSARPYLLYGRALARAGRFDDAIEAYRRSLSRATPATTAPRLALPALLAWAGRETQANGATRQAHEISWNEDPWMALEIAWAELPPPRTDEIVVGGDDYGAVRCFLQPRGDLRLGRARTGRDTDRTDGLVVPPGLHRWSRHRSWLRLAPRTTAATYDLTVMLGVPPPGRLPAGGASARLRVGEQTASCALTAEVRPCVLRVAAPPLGQAWLVELIAPVWNRVGEPADQGVRVERLTVAAAP